jgi:hypothetical protein
MGDSKIMVLFYVMPCTLADRYQWFLRTGFLDFHFFHLEDASSSKIPWYISTRLH